MCGKAIESDYHFHWDDIISNINGPAEGLTGVVWLVASPSSGFRDRGEKERAASQCSDGPSTVPKRKWPITDRTTHPLRHWLRRGRTRHSARRDRPIQHGGVMCEAPSPARDDR